MQTNMKEVTVAIPQSVHQYLIGRNGRLIRAVCAECNGVSIKFPPPGVKSEDVTIRGAPKDIENAKKQLLELAKEKVCSVQTCDSGRGSRPPSSYVIL